MKDHEIRELVNRITEVVKVACPKHPDSIREMISRQVRIYLKSIEDEV